jgi:hypothetical protein
MLEYLALAGGLVDRAGSSIGSGFAALDLGARIDALLSDPAQLALVMIVVIAGGGALAWLLRRL